MFAECLTVIAGRHHDGFRQPIPQCGQKTANLTVRCRNFIVVAVEHRPRRVVAVRGVRFEQMDPEEETGWRSRWASRGGGIGRKGRRGWKGWRGWRGWRGRTGGKG